MRFTSLNLATAFALLAATALTGCTLGYAQVVRQDTTGGTLSLQGMQGPAMEDAQQQMAAHCQGPYQIVRQEQVVVGEQTQSNYGESYGRRSTRASGSQTTRDLTEMHVTYACGGGQQQQVVVQQQPQPQQGVAQPQY